MTPMLEFVMLQVTKMKELENQIEYLEFILRKAGARKHNCKELSEWYEQLSVEEDRL